MREIKFRAWDTDCEEMHYFVLGDGVPDDEDKIMQYTGLKDKGGREIYEGDIVKTVEEVNSIRKGWLFTVSWHSGDGNGVGLKLYGVGKYINSYPFDYMDHANTYFNDDGDSEIFEVIGNIYENKELLK